MPEAVAAPSLRTAAGAARAAPLYRDAAMLIALIAIWAFFAIMQTEFLGPRNLSKLSVDLAITATLALGAFLVMLPGQIDLASGSGVGLFGGLAAVLVFHSGMPAPAALGISAVAAVAIWAGMGALIVRQGVPAFIITLAGLLVFKGCHWLVIGNKTVPISAGDANLYALLTTWYLPPAAGLVLAAVVSAAIAAAILRGRRRRRAHGLGVEHPELAFGKALIAAQLLFLFVVVCNQYRGVPLPALILGAVAFGVHLLTRHMRFGRHLYAIGGNAEAAALAGIRVDRTVIVAFAITGSIVALTGFLQTAFAGNSTTTVGELMELDAIAACVIGGTALRGGRGSVPGVLFGALIMASLLNGMGLMALPAEQKLIARGVVLALAVWLDVRLSRARSGAAALA